MPYKLLIGLIDPTLAITKDKNFYYHQISPPLYLVLVIFTVRSACYLYCGTTFDGSLLRKFWKKIWSLPIPHKVRHFCWCACRDTLPTKVKLKRRNVIVEDMCVCCHDMVETTDHIFWGCTKAQETWATTKLQLPPSDVHIDSFQDLLWFVMMTKSTINSLDQDTQGPLGVNTFLNLF